MTVYKFLRAGAVGPFTDFAWPVPEEERPGAWVDAAGELTQCGNGIHACRVSDLPFWLAEELWTVELAGAVEEDSRQLVAERARLRGRIDAWSAQTARELADDCMLRTRDLACAVLRDAGLVELAGALASAGSAEALEQAGASVRDRAAAGAEFSAARAAGAAATAGMHGRLAASRPDPVVYAAFTAHAAGMVAELLEPAGYAAERARQATWLANRLELA